jgi:hypothetical protein
MILTKLYYLRVFLYDMYKNINLLPRQIRIVLIML